MKRKLGIVLCAAGLFALQSAGAKDEAPPESYVYATYMYCNVLGEDEADAAFKRAWAPVYEQAMKDGTITGWGYLKHHTGGKWRRLTYHMGPSVSAVIAAGGKLNQSLDARMTEEDEAFARACQAHDDYIWQRKAGNVTAQRGKVGMSVYFKCDMSREAQADEIVEKYFADVYNKHLGKGKLTSWGWMSHVVGGAYRRIATMTAEDIDTLLKMRASILGADLDSEIADEFIKICGSHQDYIWTIEMEGRS